MPPRVGRELPKQPSMFIRFADTLVGHGGEMIRPTVSDNFDFEGELALVIGKAGRHIKAEHALDHVAGYTCFVDGSVRDYQKFSVTSGKNFPGTGPLGPWLVTTDEIPDPSRLTLTTRLNGKEVQHATTDQLIYAIPQIIAFCSDFTALSPGDVIATGTPEGVGHSRKPPLWMKPGDALEVEISGIGMLRARIVDERSLPLPACEGGSASLSENCESEAAATLEFGRSLRSLRARPSPHAGRGDYAASPNSFSALRK